MGPRVPTLVTPAGEVSTADHEFSTALPSTDAAPAMARHRVAAACLGWPQVTVDVALILTSELVTNAVRHGGGPIRLDMELTEGVLHVEVYDGSPAVPRRTPASRPDGESGHGLVIVAELASDWGARTRTDSPGKVVWFDLRLG